jgi:UDP-N-acetylglucosamine:LPS N-acetylglucosamine transferase
MLLRNYGPRHWEICKNEEKLKSLAENIATLAKPNAANEIATIILNMIQKK